MENGRDQNCQLFESQADADCIGSCDRVRIMTAGTCNAQASAKHMQIKSKLSKKLPSMDFI